MTNNSITQQPEMSSKAAELLDYIKLSGYICPQSGAWNELWKILFRKAEGIPGVTKPSPPLILGAWNFSTGLEKMLRFNEHISWADKHGAIEDVDKLLRSYSSEQWFHG